MPSVRQIIDIVDQIAPFSLAESWDNSGLQVGDPDWLVSKILIALDVTEDCITQAEKTGCDMLISHHPLIMSPEKKIDFSRMPGAVILACARSKISVVSAHTSLDKAADGLNDYLAHKLQVSCTGSFLAEADFSSDVPDKIEGLGRVGHLASPLTLRQLAERIKDCLNIPLVRTVGPPDTLLKTAALCSGSGGSLTSHFLETGLDVYITGDLKYHEARDIEAAGKTAIDAGHFPSEHIAIDLLKSRLAQLCDASGYDIQLIGFTQEKDPFLTM